MEINFYLQNFDTKFPTLDKSDNIHLKILNYYVGQDYKDGKQFIDHNITIAVDQDLTNKKTPNGTTYKSFWPMIIKLDIDEAKDLRDKLTKIIRKYNNKQQAYETVKPS